MTNWSSRSLEEKLGIKPGMRSVVLKEPEILKTSYDFIQFFARKESELREVLPELCAHLQPGGMLWLMWAKKVSPLHSGLDETMVRRLGLGAGMVDVKVVAMDDDWSGLKFVFRLKDRKVS